MSSKDLAEREATLKEIRALIRLKHKRIGDAVLKEVLPGLLAEFDRTGDFNAVMEKIQPTILAEYEKRLT